MDKQNEQEHDWDILIEIELYALLGYAKDDLEEETFLREYCEQNEIPIQYARKKIERMKQQIAKAEQESVEHGER